MTKHSLLIIPILFFSLLSKPALTQDSIRVGKYTLKPLLLVYADAYTAIGSGENPSAIEIKRAYLGYSIAFQKGFSSKVELDIGKPEANSSISLLKRYAYFKYAYLQYKTPKTTIKFGIIPMPLFKVQEKIWGHRYVAKAAGDEYEFGCSSDLGLSINYALAKFVSIDFTISNGEGSGEVQSDKAYKSAVGITMKPIKGFIIRAFANRYFKTNNQIIGFVFLGYEIENKLKIGIEYDRVLNFKNIKNQDLNLCSATASYYFSSTFEIFGRIDQLKSRITNAKINPWNPAANNQSLICGIQFSPIPHIRMALNYRTLFNQTENSNPNSSLYLNIAFGL